MSEVYQYYANQEIRQIVMGIQSLKCGRNIERERYLINTRDSEIDYLAAAKEAIKHDLLDHISDFILVKEVNDGFGLEAELHLPYVRDSKVKELEGSVKFWMNNAKRSEREITGLCKQIRLLQRPWWKKLFKIKPIYDA